MAPSSAEEEGEEEGVLVEGGVPQGNISGDLVAALAVLDDLLRMMGSKSPAVCCTDCSIAYDKQSDSVNFVMQLDSALVWLDLSSVTGTVAGFGSLLQFVAGMVFDLEILCKEVVGHFHLGQDVWTLSYWNWILSE